MGLRNRLQASSARALNNTKTTSMARLRRESAEKRADGKYRDAAHVKTFAPHDGREPAAERQHDGIGDEIRGQDPRALVLARGKASGNMGQRHIGDAGVKHLHKRGQRHDERDDHGLTGERHSSASFSVMAAAPIIESRLSAPPTFRGGVRVLEFAFVEHDLHRNACTTLTYCRWRFPAAAG